jgi:MFS family permease
MEPTPAGSAPPGPFKPDASEAVFPPAVPASPLPGAGVALALLLGINLFNYIDRQVLAAVEPKIRSYLFPGNEEAGKDWTGWLSTAFLVTYMLTAPLFGWLADRMPRWRLIGIGVILWSLASGASGLDWKPWGLELGGAFWALLLTRCFVGVGEAAYGPVAPTVIADFYPVAARGRVMAWFFLAIPVGGALGYALGGQMVATDPDQGWRKAFFLVVPPGLLLGLWCFLMRDPPRGQADAAGQSRPARWADYRHFLRTPSYVLDTLGMAAMTFAIGALAYWMPDYLISLKKAGKVDNVGPMDPVTFFGALVALSGLVATLAGGIAGDRLRNRFSGSYFLVSGIAMIVGFPMVLLFLWAPFPLAWVFMFLAVFCLFFNTGPTNTVIANVTHPSVRASAFALNIFVIHILGDAISPPLIGSVSRRMGMPFGFAVVSATMVLGGVLWLWGARYLERDTRLALTRLDGGG